MSKEQPLIEFGSVGCHEDARDGLTFAGSVVHVKMRWKKVVSGGEVYLQSNGMADDSHKNLFIVLDPHEARALGAMLIEAGKKTEPRKED